MDITFQFSSLADMFYMSGHGPYVWSCYIITFAGLGYLMVSPRLRRKRFFRIHKAIARRSH